MASLCALWCIGLLAAGPAAASEWSYSGKHGPSHWSPKACSGGRRQSPIDIERAKAALNCSLGALRWHNAGRPLTEMLVQNNGHTVQFTPSAKGKRIYMTGAGLPGGAAAKYDLLQMHLHWKAGTMSGSEHSFDGRRTALEAHFVHRRRGVEGLSDLVVLGVLFQVKAYPKASEARTDMRMLADAAYAVKEKGVTAAHYTGTKGGPSGGGLSVRLADLLQRRYYQYAGSLTTPPCSEAVTWLVDGEPYEIDAKTLSEIHAVKDAGGRTYRSGNNRPTEPLNGRLVSVYDADKCCSA